MPADAGKVPAIVLAAGLSSRMGDFKPLLSLAGKALIHHVVDALRASGAVQEIIVVTGHEHRRVEAALARYLHHPSRDRQGATHGPHRPFEPSQAVMAGVRLVYNPDYARGEMLSSLRAGITALGPVGATPGFLLAFADQPAVAAETIAALVRAFAVSPSVPYVVPMFHGKRGHPILLSWSLVPEIAALGADETLRTVTQRHRMARVAVEVDDPAVLEDLDTPEDFARAVARASGRVAP